MGGKENYLEEAHFSKDAITEQVQRIFCYPVFATSDILKGFLSFIVEETISGRANQLKEYTIGVAVLNKPVNYKPQIDGLVRIHARRLRRALDLYYKEEGMNNPITILIPKGSYMPVFEEAAGKANGAGTLSSEHHLYRPIVLAVLPFKHHEENVTRISFAEGLGELLTTELSRFQDISIIAYYTMRQIPGQIDNISDLSAAIGSQYVITGNIQFQKTDVRINVRLIDTSTSELVWSKFYEREFTPESIFAIQDDIVQCVILELGDYCGLIVRHVAHASRFQKTNDLEVYNAILWYYHFHSAFTPEAFESALKAMELAVKREPGYAMAWSCLSELYLSAYMFDRSIEGNVYEQGLKYAFKAVQLDPNCQNAYIALALSHTYLKSKEACHQALEKCIALNPQAITLIGMAGFFYIISGEHEKGFELMEKSIKYNRFYPPWFNGGIAFYYLMYGNFEQAHYWAKKMNLPGIAWDFLLRASILGHLGKIGEASDVIKELFRCHPNFVKRRQEHMSLLVLNEELLNILLKGLRLAGI